MEKKQIFGHTYNGIFSGVLFYAFSSISGLRSFLTQISLADPPGTQYILTIFTVPKLAFYPVSEFNSIMDLDIQANPRPVTLTATPNNLDSYVPRNQKLRTFPYMYLAFNPNSGSGKIFRYEDFENGIPLFNMISEINPNPQVCVIPQNYKGTNGDNLGEIAEIRGYPTISWSNDVFNTWLAQNNQFIQLEREKENFNYMQNVGKTGVNMVGNMFGMMSGNSENMASGFSNFINNALDMANYDKNHEFFIKGQMAEQEYHSKLPNERSFRR